MSFFYGFIFGASIVCLILGSDGGIKDAKECKEFKEKVTQKEIVYNIV